MRFFFFAPYICDYIPIGYRQTVEYVFWIISVQVALMGSTFMGTCLSLLQKSYAISAALVISLVMQLVMQQYFLTLYPPLAAMVYGLCIGSFVFFMLSYALARTYFLREVYD